MKRCSFFFFILISNLCFTQVFAQVEGTILTDPIIFRAIDRGAKEAALLDNLYRNIGGLEVKGNTMILFGNNITDVYTPMGIGVNLPVRFDSYDQQFSIVKEDRQSEIILNWNEVDSFFVKIDSNNISKGPRFYINSKYVDPSQNLFLERLVNGAKYNLYNAYHTETKRATMDIAQTNKQEFVIMNDFYYTTADNPKTLVKIKSNFKNLTGLTSDGNILFLLNDKYYDKETRVMSFFNELNK